jgi:hypothetical protein
MIGESNVPGAVDGQFWPLAAIQPQLVLAAPIDPTYTADTPRPLALRALGASPRLIGALQSAP